MKRNIVVGLAMIVVAAAVAWKVSQPSSYEECIEKNIGKAQTESSARIINSACKQKFKVTYSDAEVFGKHN